jgi:hypothetical protein
MFDQLWRSLFDQLAGLVPDVSPFWFEWLPLGVAVIFACVAVAWFFPILRSLAGAVVIGVIAGLFGYRRGETEYAARHKPAPRPTPPKDDQWGWRW